MSETQPDTGPEAGPLRCAKVLPGTRLYGCSVGWRDVDAGGCRHSGLAAQSAQCLRSALEERAHKQGEGIPAAVRRPEHAVRSNAHRNDELGTMQKNDRMVHEVFHGRGLEATSPSPGKASGLFPSGTRGSPGSYPAPPPRRKEPPAPLHPRGRLISPCPLRPRVERKLPSSEIAPFHPRELLDGKN